MNINKLYQIQYKIFGLLIILLGSTVISGWIIKSERIIRIYADFSPMQFNTAICFILSGIILLFIKRKIAFVASLILLIIASATFLEQVTNQSYGIDEYFIKSFLNPIELYPGRMAPNTSISFVLFAIVTILCKIKDNLLVQNLQICMLFIISSIAIIAIVSYSINLDINHGAGQYVRMALHSAIGLLILSQSLLVYISQQKSFFSNFSPWLITFGLLIITFLGWQALKNRQELNLAVVIEKELQNIINLINSNLTERTKSFSRITYRWLATPNGTPYKAWVDDINHYIIDQPGYVGIEWVDNKFIVRWAEPKDNNKIVGYNLSKDNHRRELIEKSIKQKRLTISSTIDLLQGNKGILLIDPLIKNDKVLGFMVGVIDTKIFFDYIFKKINHDEKIVTIRNQDELIYSTYTYGDNNVDYSIKWRSKKNLTILGQKFTVEITPKKNLYDQVISSNLETLILLMGLLISILSGVTTTYLITTKKLQKEVFKANDWLKGILECTTEYIAAIDTDFKFMAFNQAYSHEVYRLFKINLSIGMSFMTLANKMDEANREKIIGLWHKIFKGENHSTTEEFKLSNNKSVYYDIHFNPIYNSNGILIGASHIATNINKRIKNEKLINADRNKLKLLVNDLEKRNSELFLLKELITMLNINDSFEQFKEIFTHYASKIFPNTSGIIYLQSQSHMTFDAKISWDNWNNLINHVTSFHTDDCLALLQNQIYMVEDTQKQLLCRHVSNSSNNGQNIKSYMCIPLLSRGKKLGLAYIEFSALNNNVANKKNDFIQLVFEQVSLVLYNIQLKNHLKSQSIHDSLTGLHNKRYIEEYLNQEVIIAKRYSKKFSVMMLDIDHFKLINDTHGHFCGDMVLEKFSSILKNNLRESDLIARWGGEEFLVIFKDTSLERIKAKCEKLRKNIECLSIDFHNQIIKFTVSMGVAEYDLIETKEDLLKKADSALYQAKKQGRNKIIIAGSAQ